MVLAGILLLAIQTLSGLPISVNYISFVRFYLFTYLLKLCFINGFIFSQIQWIHTRQNYLRVVPRSIDQQNAKI